MATHELPISNEVIDQANEAIVEYTLRENDKAKEYLKREKKCGIPGHINDAELTVEDSEDRIKWVCSAENWRTKKLKVKKGDTIYTIEDDGSLEKEFS